MKRLHLICNAHIDPIWQWTWDEGFSSTIATFKSAVDLAEDFDYIFCHGESLLYEALELNAPTLFAKIQELVKKGKWHISGGSYLQPDCLMPNGESLVRQYAVGKKYFKEKFGVEPTVATNYDSFGHSLGLVQILAKNGYKGYMHCRPNGRQFSYPSKFYRWVAPDGSSILATQTFSYSAGLGKAKEKIQAETTGVGVGMLGSNENGDLHEDLAVDYVLWGVGNHGGGPSRKDLQDILNLKIDGVDIFHSTQEDLFADNLEVNGEVRESLITCMPGCYSSMARVKQGYRKAESLFFGTEKMVAGAMLAGFIPNLERFTSAEKELLLAQFHDIIPGTCVEEGERESLGVLSSCEKAMRDYRTQALLYFVAEQEKAGDGEFPVFVFNYEPKKVKRLVEVEFTLADQNWNEEIEYKPCVFTMDGQELVCQQIKEDSTINLDWRKRIVFEGELLPLGVTRFTVKVVPVPRKSKTGKPVNDLQNLLQAHGLNSEVGFDLYDDTADPWGMSRAELKAMGKNPTPFSLMSAQKAQAFCRVKDELAPVRIIEDGEVYTGVEALYTAENSNAVLQYRLYKKQPFIDLKVTVEFAEKNKLVRVKIPVPSAFENGKAFGDGPFICEDKPSVEICYQKWLGVKKSDGEIFAVINDGVYAGKVENGYIHLTLLRGAGYCFHPIGEEKEVYPQDRYLPRIDCGRYTYKLRLFTGKVFEVCEQAESFNLPPYAVNIFPVGAKGNAKSNDCTRFSVDGEVILSAFKSSEKGRFVARVYNPDTAQKAFTAKLGEICAKGVANGGEVVSIVFDENGATVVHDKMPV